MNFCVAHKAWNDCMDLPIDTFCPTCSTQTGLREFIFEGIDTLPQFSNWILGDENKGVTCIAHNFRGYDGQFILLYILEYGTVKPEVIMNGNTILRMKVGHVTFLDSYQFFAYETGLFPRYIWLDRVEERLLSSSCKYTGKPKVCGTLLSSGHVQSWSDVCQRS